MSTKSTSPLLNPIPTRSSSMDDFNHVIQIMDIGKNSCLERALQIRGINSVRKLLRMDKDTIKVLEYKKSDKLIPVPDFQISSLQLFIEYCKYRARVNNHILDYTYLTQDDLDQFNLLVPVTVTSPIPGSSTYPPTHSTLSL